MKQLDKDQILCELKWLPTIREITNVLEYLDKKDRNFVVGDDQRTLHLLEYVFYCCVSSLVIPLIACSSLLIIADHHRYYRSLLTINNISCNTNTHLTSIRDHHQYVLYPKRREDFPKADQDWCVVFATKATLWMLMRLWKTKVGLDSTFKVTRYNITSLYCGLITRLIAIQV